MKCPNCNETEHEPTAKYCHVCGSLMAPKWDYEQLIQKALGNSDRLEKKLDNLERLIEVSQKKRSEQQSELQRALDELARLQKKLDEFKDL